MSEFPSLPLFTDAFIADTGHLTAQETGAYLLLLMTAWRLPECRLPDDDARLARWARVDLRTWRRMKPVVMGFWSLDQHGWLQKRLSKEREIVSKRAAAARDNGHVGGRPKSLKSNGRENPAGLLNGTQQKAPNPNPIEKEKEKDDGEKRGVVLVERGDRLWEGLASRFERERGKRPPTGLGGWRFPEEWVRELSALAAEPHQGAA